MQGESKSDLFSIPIIVTEIENLIKIQIEQGKQEIQVDRMLESKEAINLAWTSRTDIPSPVRRNTTAFALGTNEAYMLGGVKSGPSAVLEQNQVHPEFAYF